MAFDIHNIKTQNNLSLLDLLLNGRRSSAKIKKASITSPINRDTVIISSDAKELLKTQTVSPKSANTKVDATIDLQSYFNDGIKENADAILNAGNEITANNSNKYTSEYDACKAALTEKYSRLVKEAKTHSNPQDYIYQKYFDKGCSWYAGDLDKEERRIAYNYEKQMLNEGKIRNVKFHDSLFRGVTINGDSVDTGRKEFDRQMVNSQMKNVLTQSGIQIQDQQKITFIVDPYSYYISVKDTDEILKFKIENAVNSGENGKNLYKHIISSANCDGIESTQITDDGKMKNSLFYNASTMLGLDIRTLEERNGTYYTDAGEDILDLFSKSIDQSKEIPDTHKTAVKEWCETMVHQISSKGWNNIKDMILSIDYTSDGLLDKYQNYGFGATSREWLEGMIATSKFSTIPQKMSL